ATVEARRQVGEVSRGASDVLDTEVPCDETRRGGRANVEGVTGDHLGDRTGKVVSHGRDRRGRGGDRAGEREADRIVRGIVAGHREVAGEGARQRAAEPEDDDVAGPGSEA